MTLLAGRPLLWFGADDYLVLTPTQPSHSGVHTALQDIDIQWEAPADATGNELTARYVPLKVGSYSVSVTYKGAHIKGSPWPLTVVPADGRAAHSALSGIPSRFLVGQPVSISLLAKDGFGNATAGGDTVVIVADSTAEGGVAAFHRLIKESTLRQLGMTRFEVLTKMPVMGCSSC